MSAQSMNTTAVIDTGANICLMSRKAFNKLGAPGATVAAKISCDLADNQRIKIREATWLKITTTDGGVTRKTRQRMYIMSGFNFLVSIASTFLSV